MINRRNLIRCATFGGAAPLAWQLAARSQAQISGEIKPGVVFYFFPEGTWPDEFFPKVGAFNQFPIMSKPLSPWAPLITFIDGLSMYGPRGIGWYHEAQPVALAAGAPTSIDNVIARELMLNTPVPNLRVSVINFWEEKVGNSRINGETIKGEDNPLKLYARLFGQGPLAQDANLADIKKLAGLENAALVENQLDRLDGIHRAITRLPVPPLNLRGLFTPATNFSKLPTYNSAHLVEAITDIQQNIVAMALGLGLTRCVDFNVGHEFWPVSVLDEFGGGHLDTGHRGGEDLRRQVQWHMRRFASFLAKLAVLPGPAGNLLQSTFCLTYSNMGMAHGLDRQSRMPFVLAGGQALGHQGGRVLDYRAQAPNGLPHAQLYTALAQKMGVNIEEFGDVSTFANLGGGPLPGLWQ